MRRQHSKRRSQQHEQKFRVEVLYEDSDVIVIDKPAGLISYPLKGRHMDSAIGQIRKYWNRVRSTSKHLYLLHRLDQETSGLMIFAKNTASRRSLMAQFAEHSVKRVYIALTEGIPEKSHGSVKTLLGRDFRGKRAVSQQGRLAITRYEVVKTFPEIHRALVRCTLHTGRTHQVRIHLAHLGSPVMGDPVYGKRGGSRMMLHAEAIGFIHPGTGRPILFRTSNPFASMKSK
jgi:23S rRNA pseudouridine1911/1915/1917 synthase